MTVSALDIPAPADAIAHCRRVTQKRARNFYYGLKLAPEPKRSALFVLYAWMRRADDLVDSGRRGGGGEHLRAEIERFRDATHRALRGEDIENDDPLWSAFTHIARSYELDAAALDAMIDGQLDDLAHDGYETFDALRDYCYRVASTVGLLCIRIFGYSDPRAEALAVERGMAFQLTNMLRDYAEDFDDGRVYFPREDFELHNLTPGGLREWADDARCRAFVAEQVKRTRSLYARSASLDALIDADCRAVLWAMTSIYETLLDRIADDPQRIVSGARIRVGAIRKGMIALEAKRRGRARPAKRNAPS